MWSNSHSLICVLLTLFSDASSAFSFQLKQHKATSTPIAFLQRNTRSNTRLQSSFAADGSEYSSTDKGNTEDDDESASGFGGGGFRDDGDETATVELQPIPTSKNSGNRFVAFVWDQVLDNIYGSGSETSSASGTTPKDALDLHYDRMQHTEDHVMFCRKTNLYNDTFNTESNTDILWSLPILSSDLKRVIGSAMCLETTKLEYAKELLSREPVIQSLTGGDLTHIPVYRWRHIRDYSLRQDDGRYGFPCMMLGMDEEPEQVGNLRNDVLEDNLEYLINSERVIAAGPLHLPTEFKDDPSSIPVGDLILFNAMNRDEAIVFAENLPSAEDGLYKDLRVSFYNSLDITGKFVSEDPLRDAPGGQMKEALEYWGYPTADDQTPWLNC